ncbi:MAG TPA: zinc metalloprotease [Nocardioidaceae bacterium]|nr:zinc metalloprotease [Nocardioidaceae bacterium]
MKHVLLGGIAAVTMLGGGLAAPAAASTPVEDAADYCVDTASHTAKVPKGTSMWRDPDNLTVQQAQTMEFQSNRILARAGLDASARRPNGSVKISVTFHVVTNKEGKGWVSKSRIQRQIRVLNRAFGGRTSPVASNTPFRFKLKAITHTKKTNWYSANPFAKRGVERLKNMQKALRVGGSMHLNVYTVGFHGGSLLGYASFPTDYILTPKLDGMVLWDETLPGGDAEFESSDGDVVTYNRGDTATHEVGHWMYLHHPFIGGCSYPNDYVADTPPQDDGANTFDCGRKNNNTCGPRPDPVHNFMNYGDDICLDRFTRDQRQRMNQGWRIRQALSSLH